MAKEFPAFDRYAPFTDLGALNAYSARPLRKAVRVNTLKRTVASFRERAQEKEWKLESVPWCGEGFFIERDDRSTALGRDPLQLFGHFYIQEAASMLPPALLQARPGEHVLDMSAAPGSKTTQLAAAMGNRGVIVANDVQEKRLWTLKNALHRLGATNVIVTKKVGQWFARHMTERFDRVLCDAPCTGQGTVRKDPDALQYCSLDSIRKMHRLQTSLLDAAVHAAKVGGRIVYSTCTLTPEENEQVVLEILARYEGKIEVIDPLTLNIAPDGFWQPAIEDSHRVQQFIARNAKREARSFPFLRLWPHTYDTEGFFCAVLQKTAATRSVDPMERMEFQERPMPRSRVKEVMRALEERYGTSFLNEEDMLFERGTDAVVLAAREVQDFPLPVRNYSLGLPFAKRVRDGRLLLQQETAWLRGTDAASGIMRIDDRQLALLLDGQDIDCPMELKDHILLIHRDLCIGLSLAKNGRLKNNLSRSLVQVA